MYLSPRNDEMAAGDPFIMSPAVIAGLGLPTDSRGNELVISGLVLSSIALFLVGIRIYGRAIVSRVVGWDDYWAIPAVFCAVALTVLNIASVNVGLGSHVWITGALNLQVILKYAYFAHLLYIASLGCTRVSLLLQLIRLAPHKRMRTLFQVLMGWAVAATVAAFIAQALICFSRPSVFWTTNDMAGEIASGRCMPYSSLQRGIGAVNIFTDFIIWLSPLKIIWDVRLPRAQKAGLATVFVFGALVWIAAISRLVYAGKASADVIEVDPVDHVIQADPSYKIVDIALWTSIEVHIAIICCAIPTIRPFLKRFLPGFLKTDSSRTRSVRLNDNSTNSKGGRGDGGITMGSISVISKVPSLELDDEYSSSTERFATLTNSVSIGMGPTTEIEGGCEVLEGDEVGEDHKGIFMRTQVTMRVHNNKAPIDDGDMA